MPRYVNRSGASEDIFLAFSKDEYSKEGSDISATELITPPRIRQLMARHDDDIEIDVSDRVYMLFGRVAHGIMERVKLGLAGDNHELRNAYIMEALEDWLEQDGRDPAQVPAIIEAAIRKADAESVYKSTKRIFERRLFIDVNGWTVSGAMDDVNEETGHLKDYKLCSVWATKGEVKREWEQQMNIYAHILRKNGIEIKTAEVEALYRDFSKTKATISRDGTYPKTGTETISIPLWDPDKQEQFILERVMLHQVAEKLPDDSLPLCTPEERWVRDPKVAVMKEGRKSAVKLFEPDEKGLANEWIRRNAKPGEKLFLVERDGTSVRCESGYCQVAHLCAFGRALNNRSKAG